MADLPAGFKPGWAGDHAIWRTARKTYDCHGNGAHPSEHAPDCTLRILPGDNYVEYVGETAAYARGSAHCVRCAVHFKYIECAPGFALAIAAAHGARIVSMEGGEVTVEMETGRTLFDLERLEMALSAHLGQPIHVKTLNRQAP